MNEHLFEKVRKIMQDEADILRKEAVLEGPGKLDKAMVIEALLAEIKKAFEEEQ